MFNKFLLLLLLPCALSADLQSDRTSLDKEIAEFKTARDSSQMKADLAGRNADRVMQQDWMEYRHELQRQEMFQQEVVDLDAKIADLEKQKSKLEAKNGQ